MPILDLNGDEILHHEDFPINIEIKNIEFGAGRNFYGKKEYPKCYLTDLSYPDFLHFTENEDYNEENSHFLDEICDFYEYNFERTFENIILCNPYGFGFKDLGVAKRFFDRAGQLLIESGEIHIIGSSVNPWCSKDSFEEYLLNEIEIFKSQYNFQVQSFEELSRECRINTTYRFYKTELKEITIPNQKLVIKKL